MKAIAILVLILTSLAPMAARAEEHDAAAYLDRMAGTDGATYHARQLVVLLGDKQSSAVIDVRSSPDGTFVRSESGGEVTRVWRNARRGVVAGPNEAIEDRSPLAMPIRSGEVLEKFDVSVGPAEEILGVDVVPLTFTRRSDRRTVEKLWVQASSGVVYRRELYGEDGRLVGLSTILDMSWGEQATVESFDPEALPSSRVGVMAPRGVPRRLPSGYALVGALSIEADGRPADHFVYSDGFHTLSVFRTHDGMKPPDGFSRVDMDGAPAWSGPGPGTWAWEGGGDSFVMVSEESSLDPSQMTKAFPHGGRSVWARLGSVWSRGFHLIADL